MKTLLIILCSICTAKAFAQKSTSKASELINCLGDRTVCTAPPYYPLPPSATMKNAPASANAQEFLNGLANSLSVSLNASSADAGKISSSAYSNLQYASLDDYLKANPKATAAAKVQQLLLSSGSYENFQNELLSYYNSLSNAADKDYIYTISAAMSIIDQNVSGLTNRTAGCSGWWSCWGSCVGSIVAGALSGGLTGAVTGSAAPVVGTVAGGIVGGVAGGITGAVKGC